MNLYSGRLILDSEVSEHTNIYLIYFYENIYIYNWEMLTNVRQIHNGFEL